MLAADRYIVDVDEQVRVSPDDRLLVDQRHSSLGLGVVNNKLRVFKLL